MSHFKSVEVIRLIITFLNKGMSVFQLNCSSHVLFMSLSLLDVAGEIRSIPLGVLKLPVMSRDV